MCYCEELNTSIAGKDSHEIAALDMDELNDAREKSSDQEVLSVKKQVIDGMQQLTEKYKKLSKHPVQSATMKFKSSSLVAALHEHG